MTSFPGRKCLEGNGDYEHLLPQDETYVTMANIEIHLKSING